MEICVFQPIMQLVWSQGLFNWIQIVEGPNPPTDRLNQTSGQVIQFTS